MAIRAIRHVCTGIHKHVCAEITHAMLCAISHIDLAASNGSTTSSERQATAVHLTTDHLIHVIYRQTSNISRTQMGNNIVDSFRCSWSIACRRCSNYIFILDLKHGFSGFDEDNYKTMRETFKFRDLLRLILGVWHYWYPILKWATETQHNVRVPGRQAIQQQQQWPPDDMPHSIEQTRFYLMSINPSPLDRQLADDIYRCIFVNETFCIWMKISLKFVPKSPINYNSALI